MRTLFLPGMAPLRPCVKVRTYFPSLSVVAPAGRPFSGMNTTEASGSGFPSNVTVPSTDAISGPPVTASQTCQNQQARSENHTFLTYIIILSH